MNIAEYLYVDHRRLDSYFEQVGSLEKVVTIPTWKVRAGFSGINVERSQQTSVQAHSVNEKIAVLVEKLDPVRHLSYNAWDRKTYFALTSFDARRVTVPPKTDAPSDFRGLAIWLCQSLTERDNGFVESYADRRGYTFLIEDFRSSDEELRQGSPYTLLWGLLGTLKQEFLQTSIPDIHDLVNEIKYRPGLTPPLVIKTLDREFLYGFREMSQTHREEVIRKIIVSAGALIPKDARVRENYAAAYFFEAYDAFERSGFIKASDLHYSVGTNEGQIYEVSVTLMKPDDKPTGVYCTVYDDRTNLLAAQFASEPRRFFEEWGATVGPPRRIDSLFRIRLRAREAAVIGYPVFVCDHPSPFVAMDRKE